MYIPTYHISTTSSPATMTSIREWKADEYQKSLSFVPKLATKVLEWLDVKADDKVLDLGCGGTFLHASVLR